MNEFSQRVKPDTALQAGRALVEILSHVHRVTFVPSDSAIRLAMLTDGAERGCCDHFTYSWIAALMPELDDDNLFSIEFDEVRRRLTVVLTSVGEEAFRVTSQLPPAFWRLEEEARFVSVTPLRQDECGDLVVVDLT